VRGVGTANAAISVVNALPLGIGAAVGIDWPATATAELGRGGPHEPSLVVTPRAARTPLVRSASAAARTRFSPRVPGALRLRVRSSIPRGRGLKSSSAVASAVALATARACGRDPTPRAIARISAEVGRSVGVSATGAFDDALAGLVSYVVVTNNRNDTVLRRYPLPPALAVALWIPPGRHPASPTVRQRFGRDRTLARRSVDAALDRDWAAAMTANSRLVESAMGYRYERLHATLRAAGAVASGVSGLGPAVAAIAPTPSVRRVLRAFPATGRRRAFRFAVPDRRRPR
jgi:shikimate kinase